MKVEMENVNTPGRTTRVDADKYEAMKRAFDLEAKGIFTREADLRSTDDIGSVCAQTLIVPIMATQRCLCVL